MREVPFKRVERYWREHYGPSQSLLVDDCEYELLSGHGSRDDVTVFQVGDGVYVLTLNAGLPYVGLTYFDLTAEFDDVLETLDHEHVPVLEPVNQVFFQEWEVDEAFEGKGDPFSELTEREVAEVLASHLG